MLNRRILRIKAFKVLYSYAENPSMTLKEVQTLFSRSCEATRDLYLFMLAVIPALTAEARSRIEAARAKFHPTEEEINPNMKFVENSIAPLLSEDPDFVKVISRKKLSWDQYDAFLRHLYDSVKSKDYYAEYMSSGDCSAAADARLFTRMFEEEFVDNDELSDILEDLSIIWVDDLAYSLTYCCKAMSDFASGRRWTLPELFFDAEDDSFSSKVIRTAYSGFQDFRRMVSSSAHRWDDDRLFNVDVVLIICGLAESKAFPSMPKGIIINEYVEISKYYSTPKSRSFVNGVLDELIVKTK